MACHNTRVVYLDLCNRQQSETHVASPLICRARAFLPASLPCRRCVEDRVQPLALGLFQEQIRLCTLPSSLLSQMVAFGLASEE